MSATATATATANTESSRKSAGPVDLHGVPLWVERRGDGDDVLLLAGLGDPVESWAAQLDGLSDRFRVTAFDNRGVGRSPSMPDGFSVADMAGDAADLLRRLGGRPAHVIGFSGGSAIAQELALRHPELVRTLILVSTWARVEEYFRVMTDNWRRLVEFAPDERAALQGFYVWIYTARAHNDGTVGRIIDDVLAFEHPQSADDFRRQLVAFTDHDAFDRLPGIAVPTLVVAGEQDITTPPRLGREVADRIPGAQFVVLPGEAHQPFQESPEVFNRLVVRFWATRGSGS